MNQILALNNQWEIDIPLNKEIKPMGISFINL